MYYIASAASRISGDILLVKTKIITGHVMNGNC